MFQTLKTQAANACSILFSCWEGATVIGHFKNAHEDLQNQEDIPAALKRMQSAVLDMRVLVNGFARLAPALPWAGEIFALNALRYGGDLTEDYLTAAMMSVNQVFLAGGKVGEFLTPETQQDAVFMLQSFAPELKRCSPARVIPFTLSSDFFAKHSVRSGSDALPLASQEEITSIEKVLRYKNGNGSQAAIQYYCTLHDDPRLAQEIFRPQDLAGRAVRPAVFHIIEEGHKREDASAPLVPSNRKAKKFKDWAKSVIADQDILPDFQKQLAATPRRAAMLQSQPS